MYNEYFGLSEQPFGLTPNTAYFHNVRAYREAFNMLRVALSNGEGFIKVVGEVGTGKTLLCRKLLNSLGDDYYTAYIPNPFLNPVALYKALAEELGLKCKTRDGINEFQKTPLPYPGTDLCAARRSLRRLSYCHVCSRFRRRHCLPGGFTDYCPVVHDAFRVQSRPH